MRLLVVDDNRANVELFQDALESEGHSVEVEMDGPAGSERARRERFDLILLDIQLPGTRGDVICRELRAAGVTTPIVALTSDAMPEQVVEGMRAGFDAYLTKPISPSALREAVRRYGSERER